MIELPKNFKELVHLLDELYNFEKILIVNTPSTGLFLDKMLLEKNTKRIKYTSNDFDKFTTMINDMNEKFDLILVDPYHEYKESIVTFELLTEILDDNGILISHDCNPPNFDCTYPIYKKGEWCGLTYAAFIENAYKNSNLYYGVIDNDYGLGIISKNEIQFVKKIIDKEKQLIFLNLLEEKDYINAFTFFREYSNEIINLIS